MLLHQNSLIELDKEIIKDGGLAEFIKLCWHVVIPEKDKLVWNWHIDLMCYALEQSLHDPDYKNLLICIPPGHMKTLTVSVFFPAWVWTHTPGTKFIFCAYGKSISAQSAKQHKDIIMSDWYQERWGNVCKIAKDSVKQVMWFENTAKGYRISTSVGGEATGRHGDIIVFDDLVKAQDAFSPGVMERANDFWWGTMLNRVTNADKAIKIGIMQRLHVDDPASRCIEAGYKTIILPAENGFVPSWTPEGVYKPHTDTQTEDVTQGASDELQGSTGRRYNLLFEQRFPSQVLQEFKKQMGPMTYAAQYEQTPVPVGGALFKSEDLEKYWDVIPEGSQYIMTVDCTFEDEKTATKTDYVVGQVWAYSKPNFYLVDQFRAKLDFMKTCQAIIDMQKKHPKVSGIHVEKKANGAAVINVLSEHISGIKPWPEKGVRQESKTARANAVQPLMQNVYLPKNKPWVDELITELLQFPAGKNDDSADALMMALSILHQGNGSEYLKNMGNFNQMFKARLRRR